MRIDDPHECPLCHGLGWKPNRRSGEYEICDHTYLIIGDRMWTGWFAVALFMFPISLLIFAACALLVWFVS